MAEEYIWMSVFDLFRLPTASSCELRSRKQIYTDVSLVLLRSALQVVRR